MNKTLPFVFEIHSTTIGQPSEYNVSQSVPVFETGWPKLPLALYLTDIRKIERETSRK